MDKFNYNSILSSVNENFTEQKGRKKAKQKKVFLLFHAETSIVQHRPNLDDSLRAERKSLYVFSIELSGVRRSKYWQQ